MDGASRRRDAALGVAVALAALLPLARGILRGQAFFFRDLSGHFFPLRAFAAAGLREGHARFWNPFTHEGEPLSLPPLGYPLDLLHVLWSSEAALSLLLALHVPLAAVGMFWLARRLDLSRPGAAAAALAYALGGFTLSSLNLYVYLQAVAWAPFVVGGLWRAARGSWPQAARASLPLAVALSTTGLELVALTLLAGLLLAWPRERAAMLRVGLAVLLGVGLAGAVLLPMAALVGDSARTTGFPTEVVLAHSVHPITLVQTVVAGLYADPARFTDSFWGQNFFPRGYPYFLSLYLGLLTLGLALLGTSQGTLTSRVLLGLGLGGIVLSLGAYAGLGPVVEALPVVRRFRFPSKAFFLVQLASALLAGLAVDALHRSRDRSTWARAAVVLSGLGGLTVAFFALVRGWGPLARYLITGFFPAEMSGPARQAAAHAIVADAWTGATVALLGALLAVLAWRGRLTPHAATCLLVALMAGDLLRGGSGLNPTVSPEFYRPSPEAVALASEVRSSGGRLFTLDAGYSPAYYSARATRVDHEIWSFGVLRETLVPGFNLALSVPTALSLDQTMLAPASKVLAPELASPQALPQLVSRLREAGVSRLIAVEPLSHPDLELLPVGSASSLAPLRLHFYRLRNSLALVELMGEGTVAPLEDRPGFRSFTVLTEDDARLLVRETCVRGFAARLDGSPALLHGERSYCAIEVPSGRHTVALAYEPPGLRAGLALSVVALAAVVVLWRRPRAV